MAAGLEVLRRRNFGGDCIVETDVQRVSEGWFRRVASLLLPFKVYPGIKTVDDLGGGRLDSASDWARITAAAKAAAWDLNLSPDSYILFDHESTYDGGGYLTGKRDVPSVEAMTHNLAWFNDACFRLILYPGVENGTPPQRPDRYDALVRMHAWNVRQCQPTIGGWFAPSPRWQNPSEQRLRGERLLIEQPGGKLRVRYAHDLTPRITLNSGPREETFYDYAKAVLASCRNRVIVWCGSTWWPKWAGMVATANERWNNEENPIASSSL